MEKAVLEGLAFLKKGQIYWPVQVSPIQSKESQKMALCIQNGEESEIFGEQHSW